MADATDRGDRSMPDAIRWQTAGHEFIAERHVYRHRAYRKSFSPDAVVKADGVPLIFGGSVIKVSSLLPERADLALDMDGNLLSQNEFERRYQDWLQWFSWHEATDLSAEPVPDVLDFVTKTPDVFNESRGLIPINYDARKPAEELPTHRYDPTADKMIEIAESMPAIAKGLEFLLEQNLQKRGPGRPPKELE